MGETHEIEREGEGEGEREGEIYFKELVPVIMEAGSLSGWTPREEPGL